MGDPRVGGVRAEETGMLTIGELARRTGLSVKLIRHWSDLGVVPPAARTAAGYRLYDDEAVARLELARTLRELGLGMAAIRDVVTRERGLPEVAAVHADALEALIRTLRLRQAVLRSAHARRSTTEELTQMTRLARLSAAERNTIVEEFLAEAMGDLEPSAYREGILAVMPDMPDEPTAEQVDAWIQLAGLVRDPALRAAMRRMAAYAAEHAAGGPGDAEANARGEAEARRVAELWVRLAGEAMAAGVPADSPAADPVVAEIVAAWLPGQAAGGFAPGGDGAEARLRLLEQLEMAADAAAERYWRLMCVINGSPEPPSIAAEGRWLTTALRANPEPRARAASIEATLAQDAAIDPSLMPEVCARVLAEVDVLVAAVSPGRFGDLTPCDGWDVRKLLDHIVYENLMWASLAVGTPRADHDADHLGDDHVEAFRAAARESLAAFRRPGMTERMYGPAPGWRLIEQLVIEMLVHGWDLAVATGRSADLAPDVAEAILPSVRAIYGDLPRTPGGSFAPERPVPPGASPADRLAAYLGRDAWNLRRLE
ncbi:TIGR03086 family protein [Sphaerisporangium album]|uniref:TIGR03086 family protein n=1 Tax=Sphaerisporangium album TaxID=509200 RepID=A0A367FDV7_9ACTN|nr:TIGR03086 family metal-binding protein [Sphaerisporangium album]RCG28553.1 TIGR03086 family protein [Sphaerisporangium album]